MPDWNSARYLRFADARTRPCRDLVARINAEPRTIVDLGCGPGNSAAVLAERWPTAEITGLDTSEDMLASACRDYPDVAWLHADIAGWAAGGGPVIDLVFSSAALQWLPDHSSLFPRLLGRARVLAAQMPVVGDSPAQCLIRDLAASAHWRSRFSSAVAD